MKAGALLLRASLWGVPRHLRDSVQGDLLEQAGGERRAWAEALAISGHFQAEPYRSGEARLAVLQLWAAAAGLLWLLPMAAGSLLAQAVVFGDGWLRAVAGVWAAPAMVGALVAGLLVGRLPTLPQGAQAARGHVALMLAAAAAWGAPSAVQAALAAGLLLAAAWLGALNRRQAEADRTAA